MIEQETGSLLHILRRGVNFEFDCSSTVDECIFRVENAVVRYPHKYPGRKTKRPIFVEVREYSYEFSFQTLVGTMIAFSGVLEGQRDDQIYVAGVAKVSLAIWIWIIYAAVIAVAFLGSFWPISTFLALFLVFALYVSARDCRAAPEWFFELLNRDKEKKARKA